MGLTAPLLNLLKSESIARIQTRGDRTPPWGEPFVGKMVFLSSFNSECTTLLDKRELYHFIIRGDAPASAKALAELSNAKLSKAPEQSRLTIRVYF